MQNNTNTKGFTSVSDVASFIQTNPQRFLEELNMRPELRDNITAILKTANPSEIIEMAYELQDPRNKMVHPLHNGVKTIVEPFAQNVAEWMHYVKVEANQNPFFKMEPPKEKFDLFKQMIADEEFQKQKKEKQEEIRRHIIHNNELNDKMMKITFTAYQLTEQERKMAHAALESLFNGEELTEENEKHLNKALLGGLGEVAGETIEEKRKNVNMILLLDKFRAQGLEKTIKDLELLQKIVKAEESKEIIETYITKLKDYANEQKENGVSKPKMDNDASKLVVELLNDQKIRVIETKYNKSAPSNTPTLITERTISTSTGKVEMSDNLIKALADVNGQSEKEFKKNALNNSIKAAQNDKNGDRAVAFNEAMLVNYQPNIKQKLEIKAEQEVNNSLNNANNSDQLHNIVSNINNIIKPNDSVTSSHVEHKSNINETQMPTAKISI